jgi:hypothetical protein
LPERALDFFRFYVFLNKLGIINSEPTRIDEDEELDLARKNKDEGAIMAVQSGLFKLLLPLPKVSPSSLARRFSPVKDESAVMFLLHPRQPLSMISVSVLPYF